MRIGHVSEGYKDLLKPVLLRDRVTEALPRERTIEFCEALETLFERYGVVLIGKQYNLLSIIFMSTMEVPLDFVICVWYS